MVDIGAQLGGYSLMAKLGHGGFASLYLGRKTGPNGFSRLAAVKVVHPHLASEDKFRLMFTDEARLNTRVQHPNIVRVEDFGEYDETLYMVMEYVYGCSLAELLQELAEKDRRITVPLAVWVIMNVADALHAAHEATDEAGRPWNIVHRDVSPQNVLLSYHGYVKLIDFGIAKARYRAHVTKTGGVKGKLRYMAPEQALAGQVDRRIDVYALGVVAWEMLTMRRAFKAGNPLQILEQIQNPTIPRASELADVPAAVDEVLAKAMSPKPDERPKTARDFRRLLADACPEALRVEPRDLAELLERTIRASRAQPPPGVDSMELPRPPLDEAAAPDPLTDRLSADEPEERWEPAQELDLDELSLSDVSFSEGGDLLGSTLDEDVPRDTQEADKEEGVAALLERMAREAQAEKPRVRDTIQEGRQEVLAAFGVPSPDAGTPPEPGPIRQREIRTMEVARREGPDRTVAWALIAIVLGVVAVAVGLIAFFVIRALG